jgi:hypothetical protein
LNVIKILHLFVCCLPPLITTYYCVLAQCVRRSEFISNSYLYYHMLYYSGGIPGYYGCTLQYVHTHLSHISPCPTGASYHVLTCSFPTSLLICTIP